MFDTIAGAVLIMLMRVGDVSIGTIRTILIVQGKKYLAGIAGFFEVLIWVFAKDLFSSTWIIMQIFLDMLLVLVWETYWELL
jgi:uncharacterized protein YebE (UPF0316 family)